ncbi:MAG: hypothetical protein UT37_C0012G0009 [Parcubacteria group bacterium GW2011_GWA2_39_18]|nr:MAG: hypothetical protein UT37_C0012G0009 [Parcubacteria group bacterium GW2011_GWA2_39_18]
MNPIIIVIFLSLAGVIGDFFIKLSGASLSRFIEIKWFIIGFLIYASTAFGWFYVMKHIKLSSLGVIYSITTVLLLVIVGVFIFHEKLNVYEIIGIVAAITSVILLSRFA